MMGPFVKVIRKGGGGVVMYRLVEVCSNDGGEQQIMSGRDHR